MPHWIALLAIVVVGWLVVAVVGGLLLGRGLGAFERRHARHDAHRAEPTEPDELRRAA